MTCIAFMKRRSMYLLLKLNIITIRRYTYITCLVIAVWKSLGLSEDSVILYHKNWIGVKKVKHTIYLFFFTVGWETLIFFHSPLVFCESTIENLDFGNLSKWQFNIVQKWFLLLPFWVGKKHRFSQFLLFWALMKRDFHIWTIVL